MQKPLKITYRNMEHSSIIDSLVQEREKKLERFCDQITGCHVLVENLARKRHGSNRLHVRIDLDVPGKQLISVADEPCRHQARDDACVAIQHAFHDIQLQLEEYIEHTTGGLPTPKRGRISEVFKEMNYGKIGLSDGTEVYFHRNSVLDDAFDRLETGTPVRFIEQHGLLGAQATVVKVIARRRAKKPRRAADH
ncbi:MAG: HPF/RaiA family ribosome-associated protein [Thiogranum sp.]|nr:HPF/RaiA family ribosome-associated protein [Thiogranum sp.]